MPFATKSAAAATTAVVGAFGRMGDTRTHIFRINTTGEFRRQPTPCNRHQSVGIAIEDLMGRLVVTILQSVKEVQRFITCHRSTSTFQKIEPKSGVFL